MKKKSSQKTSQREVGYENMEEYFLRLAARRTGRTIEQQRAVQKMVDRATKARTT